MKRQIPEEIEAAKLLYKGGFNYSKIARLLHISRSTVQRHVAPKDEGASKVTKHERENQMRVAFELRQEGLTALEIAKRLKVNRHTVGGWLKARSAEYNRQRALDRRKQMRAVPAEPEIDHATDRCEADAFGAAKRLKYHKQRVRKEQKVGYA